MKEDNEILMELEALQNRLAGFNRSMPYSLPEGYFPQLAQVLAQGVTASQSEDPATQLPGKMPFEVPEDYLSGLPESLAEAAIGSNETAGRTHRFEVPDGYFTALPDQLLVAAQSAGEPESIEKTIAFNPAWRRKALQWAVAAMLVAGAGLGAYRFTHPATPDAAAMKQLARVDADVLNAYVDQHIDEFDADLLEASAATVHTNSYMPVPGLNEQEIYQYFSEEGAM